MAQSKVENTEIVFAEVIYETEAAWKLTDGKKTAWVPKSKVKLLSEGMYSMPEWLARVKGFI